MRRLSFQPARLATALAVLVGGILGTASAAQAAAPSNDDFAAATTLSGSYVQVSAETAGATAEVGEPAHAGQPATASLWYRWTAPGDATVTTDSFVTRLDTGAQSLHQLSVYTGSRLAALTEVGRQSSNRPEVTFTAKAGTVYDIVINVPKRLAPQGYANLYLAATPSNDELAHAAKVTGVSGTKAGYIEGATTDIGFEPQHSLGTGFGGSVWFDWTAPSNGVTRFGIECCASIGTSPVMAVYTGSSMTDLTAVSSSYSCKVGAFNTCTVFHHVKGTTYHVAVQGDGTTFPLKWAPVASGCTVTGTAGADTLTGTTGDDIICGLAGNDSINGHGGDDVIVGGPGTDTVDYSSAAVPVHADLSVAAADGESSDTLQEVENLPGSSSADTLVGNGAANVLRGGRGRDFLVGQAGADRLSGDAGNDVLTPGAGADTADGGADVDEVSFEQSSAPVVVNLGTGKATGEGADTLVGLENVLGSDGADLIVGDALVNELVGGVGDDTIEGAGGNDKLYGWLGKDTMNGGAGTDYCDGGGDHLDTPVSCDTFVP